MRYIRTTWNYLDIQNISVLQVSLYVVRSARLTEKLFFKSGYYCVVVVRNEVSRSRIAFMNFCSWISFTGERTNGSCNNSSHMSRCHSFGRFSLSAYLVPWSHFAKDKITEGPLWIFQCPLCHRLIHSVATTSHRARVFALSGSPLHVVNVDISTKMRGPLETSRQKMWSQKADNVTRRCWLFCYC